MSKFVAIFAAFIVACAVMAQEPAAVQKPVVPQASEDWNFVSVAFFPKLPPSADVVDTYGLKLGIPVSYGDNAKVVGAECGFVASTSKQVKGLQAGLVYCKADKVSGVQANPIVNVADKVSGVQAGIVNVSKGETFQFGLVNYIEDSSVPFFPIVNCKF